MSSPSRKTWPIIVGGCHRSGTSLVRRILNAHSRIFCGPEVKFFRDFYGAYNVDPIRHLRFFTTARSILAEEALLEIFGKAFIDVQKRAATQANKERWADKNPENVLYLEQWQQLLQNEWLFVHVVRNPLDTVASIKEAGFPLSLPQDLEGRIELYQSYTRAGLEFGAAHPEQYYRIIYEKLVASPESVLQELMKWLGEKFETSQLDFNKKPELNRGLEDRKIASTTRVHAESVGRASSILDKRESKKIRAATSDLWTEIDPAGNYMAR
ncbi:MAG: hypothetical protein QOH39_2972 [Verrucomicrobiota bacterium]|jgi:hypothetical protein